MIVRSDFLSLFAELVSELSGSDAGPLLDAPQGEPRGDGLHVIDLRDWVSILDAAARRFQRPDFGISLAARERGRAYDNPFALALVNAPTLDEALRFAVSSSRSLGRVNQLHYRLPRHSKWASLEYEIGIDRGLPVAQAVEYTLTNLYYSFRDISKGQARFEIWFAHAPISPEAAYQKHFLTRVLFNRPCNAILIRREDLTKPLTGGSNGVFKLAKFYIEQKYPEMSVDVRSDAERVSARLLEEGSCTLRSLSRELGLHPRTLQRRLRDNNTSFFAVKDKVQRSFALNLLADPHMTIKDIAERLGYCDTPTFTRSCSRWFASTPRKLRIELVSARRPDVDPLEPISLASDWHATVTPESPGGAHRF